MLTIKWENISPTDFPTSHRWRLPEMRKESLDGDMIIWRIGFNGYKLIIWKHQNGSKITPKSREIGDVQHKGDINKIALYEAIRRYISKRRKGYLPPCSGEAKMIDVMRAELYDGNILDFPVDMDTKLDGLRLWFRTAFPLNSEPYTRGNTNFLHADLISKEISELSAYLPPNCAIDGEVLSQDNEKPRRENMSKMEYHMFDLWWEEDLCWEKRRQCLERAIYLYRKDKFGYEGPTEYGSGGIPKELIGKTRIFLTSITVVQSHEEIEKVKRIYIDEMGFEGAILRKRANGAEENTKEYNMSRYHFKKGSHALKVVDYTYEEARCLGVLDCKGAQKGCARLILKDERGNIFTCQPNGNLALRRKWFKNPELVTGKYVTFYYRNLSVHNKPQNAKVKGIRDEDGWFPDKEISMEDNYTVDE
jgi:hypothetical protein